MYGMDAPPKLNSKPIKQVWQEKKASVYCSNAVINHDVGCFLSIGFFDCLLY